MGNSSSANPAARGKLPPLEPGGFRFVTNSMTGTADEGERRRFRAVASSTVTDLAGNTITPAALEELRSDFAAGLTIFMDHDYENVVDKVFGTTDAAQIVPTPERDARTGAPIYDLIVEGIVNEPNPRAVQLHESISGGYVKFGASIGAIVRKFKRDKETGGMVIESIAGKEASIVGIPKNQRSWAYKASVAAEDLPEDAHLDDDEDDEEVISTAPAAPIQQFSGTTSTLVTNGTIGTITIKSTEQLDDPDESEGFVHEHDHSSDPAPEVTVEAAAEPGIETTPGGQEADEATPETAPEGAEEADPAIEQKADDFEAEDVVALVQKVGELVTAIGERDETIARLEGEIKAMSIQQGQLSQAQDDASETIRRVMELPLQRKAVGYVQNHVSKFSDVYDPRVVAYIEKTAKENA